MLRGLWLKAKDKNIKFFHRQANARRIKNAVEMVPLHDGTKLENPTEIVLVANHHHGLLFSKSPLERHNSIN
jgi:hypothetical protein